VGRLVFDQQDPDRMAQLFSARVVLGLELWSVDGIDHGND
jgi:hypothetical protein